MCILRHWGEGVTRAFQLNHAFFDRDPFPFMVVSSKLDIAQKPPLLRVVGILNIMSYGFVA